MTEEEMEAKANDILVSALRQYCHSNGLSLLAAYDYDETKKIVSELIEKMARLESYVSQIDDIKERVNTFGPDEVRALLDSWEGWWKKIENNPDLTEKGLHLQRLKARMACLQSREEWVADLERSLNDRRMK